MAIWKLTIEDDEGQKTVVPLVRDEYTLGRRDGHPIRLTERNVSRDHARLWREGDAFLLEDLGSYNGVFVNGHRLAEPHKIVTGDLVLIGDYRIEAHDEDAPVKPISSPPKASTSAPPITRATRESKPHRLVLLTGNEGGREFPLDKPQMVVGRGEEVDIRVNHSSVSRQHCELHSRDQEHFEVVDNGSANGIRVNGQEVKKALLAPGDTLELGDVRLKYVAAGQAFVYDAAAAEATRDLGPEKRKSGGMTWIALGVLVVAAAGVGIVVAKQGGGSDATAAAASGGASANATEDDLLAKAYALKEHDPKAAHAQIKAIPKTSPLRKDKRFVEIENAWADKALASVAAEADAAKKKAILEEVLGSGADESYRTSAADMLGDLDKPATSATAAPTPTDVAPPVDTVDPVPVPIPTAKPTSTSAALATAPAPKPTATAKPTTTAAATAAPAPASGCASWKGDYTAAMRAKEYACVRSILLPRLNAGAVSKGEARYLKAACQAMGDLSCEKRAAEKL